MSSHPYVPRSQVDASPAKFTRRQALRVGGLIAAGAAIAVGVPSSWNAVHKDATTFKLMRTRWLSMLTAADAHDPTATSIVGAVSLTDARTENLINRASPLQGGSPPWPDLPLDKRSTLGSVNLRLAYERVRMLALAYATGGSRFHRDPDLLSLMVATLDRLHEEHYNENAAPYGNWWDWQIGVPLELNATALLLFHELGPEQLSRYMTAVDAHCPEPMYSSSNRVWTIQVVAERALLVDDGAKLELARNGAAKVLQFVESGNGMRLDGSLVQHDYYAYSGGYGLSLAEAAAEITVLLAGTRWELPRRSVTTLTAWVRSGLIPWIHRGSLSGTVRGRNIARPRVQDRTEGLRAAGTIEVLAQVTDAENAQLFQDVARSIRTGDNGATPAQSTTIFAGMDRALHRRPGFTLAVSMSSSRIATYESINDENLHGWYTGSGALFLYDNDLTQFDDNYWPTVDATRVPGTTKAVGLPAPRGGAGYLSDSSWAGGVASGAHGAVSMQFQTPRMGALATVTGKKSWFLLGNEIAALGTGITSSPGQAVETVVENRKLHDAGAQELRIDGKPAIDSDTDAAHDGARWAHLGDNTASGGIGYVFRPGQRIRALRETRSGSWSDINRSPAHRDPTIHTRDYATLWLDHGVGPVDRRFSYIVLPGATATETESYSRAPQIEILANTPGLQAVRRAEVVAATFWSQGDLPAAGIRCSAPAAVLLVNDGSRLTVSISDPSQTATDVVRLTLFGPATEAVRTDDRITVRILHPEIEIDVDTRGARGATISAEFALP